MNRIFLVLIFILINFKIYANENLESKILKNLRCLVCQGQTISDSNSDFAGVIKIVVKDKIKEGLSEKQIYEFLSEKYGDWILYKPKFNYENFLLWSFPYIVLVFGGFIVVFLIKRRQKKT